MSKIILKSNYRIINIVFTCIILAIIAYSFFSGIKEVNYPIPSGSEFITGEKIISSGLSHSFSAIVRLDFSEAKTYNYYGIRIFTFFFAQLIIRIALLFLTRRFESSLNNLISTDIIISTITFIYSFWPFLRALIAETA